MSERSAAASETALAPANFARFVELNAPLDWLVPDADRRAALGSVRSAAAELLARGTAAFAAELPAAIGRAMQGFGWVWNGFYAPRGDGALHLGPAHGPPVCSPLEARGGALTSGMCFDALALNQTLAAPRVGAWPGYVSCDATSGLATVAGIVCPVRDPSGAPCAVWDLDAIAPIEPGDARFCDVLFATAARCARFESATFAPPSTG